MTDSTSTPFLRGSFGVKMVRGIGAGQKSRTRLQPHVVASKEGQVLVIIVTEANRGHRNRPVEPLVMTVASVVIGITSLFRV